jgi:predicted amidohydrolase YtcJ
MRNIFAFLLVLISFVAFADQQRADLVFTNGTIITMDSSIPQAEAIAIRGEKIIWLGKSDEAKSWIGKSTLVIDLKNTFVFPGLIDSHAHITSLGNAHMTIDLVGTPDLESVLKKVGEKASKTKGTDWVSGRGWDQNDWPDKKFPTAADLDRVSGAHPVFLERIDGHAAWVNSAALKLAGITAATKDPDGGKLLRDEKGVPTGILVDAAVDLVASKMKSLSRSELMERTKLAAQDALSKGITMIHLFDGVDAQ